jgi:hypothetical protein
MESIALTGKRLRIVGVDPDIFEEFTSATVRAVRAEMLLLEFAVPIDHEGRVYPFAVTAPRTPGDTVERLVREKSVRCLLTCIPQDRFESEDPFDLSWWRGGLAGAADLRL